jgi:hypothetical protein
MQASSPSSSPRNPAVEPLITPALRVAAVALAVLAALKVAVLLLEPRLTFFPVRALPRTPAAAGLPYEEMRTRTADGLDLRGWFVTAGDQAAGAGRRPLTLLVFHGNAENIATGLALAVRAHAAGFATALAEYRGYAGNPGSPSEKGLGLDAEAWMRTVAARPDVDPARLVIWGRSIGSAPAVRLAAGGGVAALVLESPFTSARDLLRDAGAWHLWALSWLGSYRFDQAAMIRRVRAPLLVIHGTRDEVAPPAHGRRLYDLAPGARSIVAIEGGGHNDLWADHGDELWTGAEAFLRAVDDATSGGGGDPAGPDQAG